MNLNSSTKAGLAANLITRAAWAKYKRLDRLYIDHTNFELANLDAQEISNLISMYQPLSLFERVFLPRQNSDVLQSISMVMSTIKLFCPYFENLPQIRALEGIKTIDLYLGGDIAEALLLETIEEAIHDEIMSQNWFDPGQDLCA